MTTTPETDKALFSVLDGQADVVHADFARRLERERDEARKLVLYWRETAFHPSSSYMYEKYRWEK